MHVARWQTNWFFPGWIELRFPNGLPYGLILHIHFCLLIKLIFKECARDQKIFTEAGLGFTLACTGSGNYDAMQTMNGHRFCVDRDGFPVTDYITNATLVVDCNNFMYNLATAPEDD